MQVREASNLVSLEYEYLASIIDRLCLLFFLTANVVITAGFLAVGYAADPAALRHLQ